MDAFGRNGPVTSGCSGGVGLDFGTKSGILAASASVNWNQYVAAPAAPSSQMISEAMIKKTHTPSPEPAPEVPLLLLQTLQSTKDVGTDS